MITPTFVSLAFLVVVYFAPNTSVAAIGVIGALLSLADVYGRFKEYRECVATFRENHLMRYRTMISKYRSSHCQRQTLQLAALTVDYFYFYVINERLHKMGYRWYHFAPDWMKRKPNVVLTKKFWSAFLRGSK